jgi:excinuclease UvrABC helicase subunit UvrB
MSGLWSNRSWRSVLVRSLVLISLVSLVIVGLLAALRAVDLDTLWDDLAKALLQVGLVSATVALLSWFSYEYQQERRQQEARQEARQEWLRQVLARATVAYNDVKSARRFFRVRAITPGEGGQEIVRLDDYDHHIDTILKAQLQFETLADEVLDATAIPPTIAMPLRSQFQSLEESLHRLVREYQRERAQFSGEPAKLGLDRLPHLTHSANTSVRTIQMIAWNRSHRSEADSARHRI